MSRHQGCRPHPQEARRMPMPLGGGLDRAADCRAMFD